MATIPGLKNSFGTISMAEQMVRISRLAAGPAFELQFSIAQNTVLNRLDEEILELQEEKVSSGATALLEVNVAGLKTDVGEIEAYAARTKSNRITTEDTIANMTNLIALADPSTIADFDTLLASTIADIKKLQTPFYERFGAPDGLRKVKAEALAQLESLAHNNFATAGDISSVQATLNSISADFASAVVITRINQDASFNLAANTNEKIIDLESDISLIKASQEAEKLDEIEAKRKHFAQILTSLSLSFEAAQNLTDYITQLTIFKPKIEPGSILNLFS